MNQSSREGELNGAVKDQAVSSGLCIPEYVTMLVQFTPTLRVSLFACSAINPAHAKVTRPEIRAGSVVYGGTRTWSKLSHTIRP
jgi:hypothetical protein